jgi:hypothetical protein
MASSIRIPEGIEGRIVWHGPHDRPDLHGCTDGHDIPAHRIVECDLCAAAILASTEEHIEYREVIKENSGQREVDYEIVAIIRVQGHVGEVIDL